MNTKKLDHRIATAEGGYQAERYRRERAEEKLDRRNARLRELEQDVDRLRTVIDELPHGYECASGTMMNVEEFYLCDCPKADAL